MYRNSYTQILQLVKCYYVFKEDSILLPKIMKSSPLIQRRSLRFNILKFPVKIY